MRAGDGRSGRARSFWPQRSRAQAGALAATGLVVVVVAFLASVMTGLALRSPDAAVRATIAEEPAAVTSLAVQASRSTDAATQDEAVRRVLREQFRGASVRVASSSFVPSAAVTGGGSALLLVTSDDLRKRVQPTEGRWPSTEAEVAVDTAFARAHRVSVGDTLVFAGQDAAVPVTVTALWRPADPGAPAWLGLTDGAGGTDGRMIVPDAVAHAAGDGIAAQWVLTPDATDATAAQLPRLRSGFDGVADALSEEPSAAASPFSSTGQGAATVAAMQRSVVALQAVIPVPLTVLAVCSVIALVLLGQLLAGARRVETRLLRSRGMTVRALAVASALEAAVVAVAGVAVGAVAAQLVLLRLVGGPGAGASGVLDVALPAVAALLAAVLAAVVTMVVSVRSLTDAPGAVEAGRSRTAVSAGLAVLAVIAAAVTLWRFLVFSSSGSLADGTAGVDPAGVVAPAAVLCAIALVGLSLFGPAAAAVERLAGRGRGVARVLPARQVGRGIALFAGPVALIVLAVGSLSFAAGYAGTFAGFLRDSTVLVQGAPVRADLGASGTPRSASDLSPAAALHRPGVTVSPAIVDDATVGDTDAALVVADTRLLPALTPVGSYLFDGSAAAADLHAANGIPGADLSSSGRTLRLRAVARAGVGSATATAVTGWFATDAGEAVPVTATVAADGTASLAAPTNGTDRLVAVDVAVAPVGAVDVKVAVTGLPQAADAWTLAAGSFGSSTPFRAAGRGAASAAALDAPASVRFVPGDPPPLRFAVTSALAADDDLAVGRRIEVRSPTGDLTGTVARVVAAVPGTPSERAVLADYAAVAAQLLRTTPSVARASSVWASGGDTAATAAALSRAADAQAVVTTADGGFVSRFLGGAVLSTWLGAAGCAALALAAVAAAVSSALRRRRGEVVVLRAVGLSGRQQAWTRRLEVIGVTVAAGVFGLLGGVAVVLLVGNTLARLSVVTAPSTLSVQGRVDPLGLGLGLLVLAAALAAAVWAYGSAVRRQAADTGYREETR